MELISEIEKQLPEIDAIDYRSINQQLFTKLNKTCIVIDDDPTGNQTVYDIPLLTNWNEKVIEEEFKKKTPIFFLLTNSRSLTALEAQKVYTEIVTNILQASNNTEREYLIISRSDSTLRGHFKTEIETINKIENNPDSITVFIPVMFEGGRVTVNDTHYIKSDGALLPVGESSFAKDHTFGYKNSNLKKWIQEKTDGKIAENQTNSITVDCIRNTTIEVLSKQVLEIKPGSYSIINALNYNDLDKACNALLLAEKKGKKICYRTSSSFIPSYIGLPSKGLLQASEVVLDEDSPKGALWIVGSYVSKSSLQLNYLLNHKKEDFISVEVDIIKILSESRDQYLKAILTTINHDIDLGKNVIVYTSRKIIVGETEKETVEIARKISESLIILVQQIRVQPNYILVKGGITSHDIAIQGLGMKRSEVIGQLLPGVPVWKMGEETRFPNIKYIVFPGNVGGEKSLYQITQKLT